MSAMKYEDLTGRKFHRLEVISNAGTNKHGAQMWNCLCECGSFTCVPSQNLKSGNTKSCGCWKRNTVKTASITHGQAQTRIYRIWNNMKQRCQNPNIPQYKQYGARGIRVCEEWQQFEPFFQWATANGYTEHLSIDRINNDGDYAPDNCRWATSKEQAHNTRRSLHVTIGDESKTVEQLAAESGLNPKTIYKRYSNGERGYDLIRPIK